MSDTFNPDLFKGLLLNAKGLRTQKSFAEECGMTPQYFNRLLSGKTRPNVSTLEKIAAHADNGVALDTLKKACGYPVKENKKVEEKKLDVDISKRFDWKYLINLVAALHQDEIADSPEEYLNMIVDEIKGMVFAAYVSAEFVGKPVQKGNYTYKEADFVFRVPAYTIRFKTVLAYLVRRRKDDAEEHTTLPIYARLLTTMTALQEYFPNAIDPTIEDDPEIDMDELHHNIYSEGQYNYPGKSRRMSVEERLLHSIFGNTPDSRVKVPEVTSGYGIYVENVNREKIKELCLKYKDVWPDGADPDTYRDEPDNKEVGPIVLYARCMKTLTGFPVYYINPALYKEDEEEYVQTKPVLMVAEESMVGNYGAAYKNYDAGAVLKACERIARDLGVERFGHVWFQYYDTFETIPEYETEFPDVEKLAEAKREFAEAEEDEKANE